MTSSTFPIPHPSLEIHPVVLIHNDAALAFHVKQFLPASVRLEMSADLQIAGGRNNGQSALVSSTIAHSTAVICALRADGYFPTFWREWFNHWAFSPERRVNRLMGVVPEDSEVMLPYYERLCAMSGMEFIAADEDTLGRALVMSITRRPSALRMAA